MLYVKIFDGNLLYSNEEYFSERQIKNFFKKYNKKKLFCLQKK